MVNITDVKQILQFAIDAEIKVFLDGGWGVDALLGYQSRAHNDIDIFVEKKDYQNFIEMMKANDFYEIKMEYTTLNHTVWEDLKNRIIDLHCFEYKMCIRDRTHPAQNNGYPFYGQIQPEIHLPPGKSKALSIGAMMPLSSHSKTSRCLER